MQISREKLTETLRKTHLFWDLDEKSLNGLISNCQPLFFEAEKLIFLEKSPAGKIYIPFEGSIEILKEKENKLEKISIAFPGVVFGEDALKQQSIRQTSARALEDSIILAIDGEVVAEIAANNPPLRKSTARYLNSYQLMITKSLARGDSEVILFASQPHPFRVIGKMLLGFATAVGAGLLGLQVFTALNLTLGNQIWFSLILVVMTIGWLLWQYIDWENDIFYFTDKRVINFQQRLFSSETTQETHLASIEAVQEKKSYLGRMVNYGDLIVKTFTGSMELPLVYDPSWVKDLLAFSISFAVEKMDTVDRQVFAREIQNRIEKDSRQISERPAINDKKNRR